MSTVDDLIAALERFAPPSLAESWDNVGLLVGDRRAQVERVMTCLTVTPASAEEAIDERANLIVAHHPLPFRPLQSITTDTPTGKLLLALIEARVAIYSPHTAFDSTVDGINRRLAEGLELQHIAPLLPTASAAAPAGTGAGRYGRLPRQRTLGELAVDVKKMLSIAHVQIVGSTDQAIEQVAVACGSGGEFLEAAERQGCQCLLTGEARFHTCLEAEALGRAMILVGHFASERFGVEHLARVLGAQFAGIRVWPSRRERDPLVWL